MSKESKKTKKSRKLKSKAKPPAAKPKSYKTRSGAQSPESMPASDSVVVASVRTISATQGVLATATSNPPPRRVASVLTAAEAQKTALSGLFSLLVARSHELEKSPICFNEFDDGSAKSASFRRMEAMGSAELIRRDRFLVLFAGRTLLLRKIRRTGVVRSGGPELPRTVKAHHQIFINGQIEP